VNKGELSFNPVLLRKEEFSAQEQWIEYQNIQGGVEKIKLLKGQLAFTFCQIPVVYTLSEIESIIVYYTNGGKEEIAGKILNKEISSLIFQRTGVIEKIEVSIENISIT
jgi:hypothetical protein